MYEVNGSIARIDGTNGRYNDTVNNPTERYAKNAVDNFYTYAETPLTANPFNTAPVMIPSDNPEIVDNNIKKMEGFIEENDAYLNALPPLEFEYRYMPNVVNGQFDKKALNAAAFEEMGQKKEMAVEEMDNIFAPDENYTSAGLDVNNDGKIDNNEYGASMLAADMLSKSPEINPDNLDGTINGQGMNAIMEYAKKSNTDAAKAMYTDIYKTYNLGE